MEGECSVSTLTLPPVVPVNWERRGVAGEKMRINTPNRLSDEKVPLEQGRGELLLSGTTQWVRTLQGPLLQLLPCTS